MKKIDVCFSPDLIHQYDLSNRVVVVIDILRATSCMVAGLGSGVKSITPVDSIEACEALGKQGYVMAGERGGKKVAQFEMGNSPFEFMKKELKGKKIAMTTTNGTRSIELSRKAPQVIIGAFLNLSAVARYLNNQPLDVLLFCAAWKGRFNLEDSLFAGAVCDILSETVELESDAALSAKCMYQYMSNDLEHFIQQSNHAHRLSRFNVSKDIGYCIMKDQFDILPMLVGDELILQK